MKINEIVIKVMKNTAKKDGKVYGQTILAEEMSKKSVKKITLAAVNDRLKTENMGISTAIEMLDVLDYEIVVRPKDAKDNRESYVVDPGYDRKRVE